MISNTVRGAHSLIILYSFFFILYYFSGKAEDTHTLLSYSFTVFSTLATEFCSVISTL